MMGNLATVAVEEGSLRVHVTPSFRSRNKSRIYKSTGDFFMWRFYLLYEAVFQVLSALIYCTWLSGSYVPFYALRYRFLLQDMKYLRYYGRKQIKDGNPTGPDPLSCLCFRAHNSSDVTNSKLKNFLYWFFTFVCVVWNTIQWLDFFFLH